LTACTTYRGVCWHNHAKKFRVRLKHHHRYFYLGYYADAQQAARVYDAGAAMVQGPDAVLNFDGRPPPEVPLAGIVHRLVKKGFEAEELLENWRRRVARE